MKIYCGYCRRDTSDSFVGCSTPDDVYYDLNDTRKTICCSSCNKELKFRDDVEIEG